MTDYEIVPMMTEEAKEAKGRVHCQTWLETYRGLMPDEYLSKITPERCIAMAQKFPENTLLLKIEGQVVGFACYRTEDSTHTTNEVVALYLLKKYHSMGLGYALMNAVFAMFPEGGRVVLWVLAGNERAIRFYERYGFTFTGEEKETPFGKEFQMAMRKQQTDLS